MSSFPGPRHLALAVAVPVLLFGLAWLLGRADAQGYARGRAEVQTRWNQAEQTRRQTENKARAEQQDKERQQARIAMEASNAAREREKTLRADAARARAERDSLRHQLATDRHGLRSASCHAVRERAAALTDIFEHCAGAVEDLAGAADRHASDALMYQQAWPR